MKPTIEMSGQQSAFVEKYLGVVVANPSDASSLDEVSWDEVNKILEAGVVNWTGIAARAAPAFQRLKESIRAAYAPYPDMSSEVEKGLSRADPLLAVFGPQIDEGIKTMLAQDVPDARQKQARNVVERIDKALKILKSHPIAKIIDDNGFTPTLQVVGPAIEALTRLRAVLAKVT